MLTITRTIEAAWAQARVWTPRAAARAAVTLLALAGGLVAPRGSSATVWPSAQSAGVPVSPVPASNPMDSAPDGSGGAYIAWQGNGNPNIQRLTRLGGVWPGWPARGVPLSVLGGTQAEVRVIGDGEGGAIVAWRDARDGSQTDVYAQRVNPAGAPQWTPNGVPVCTVPGEVFDPRLASDGGGGAVVTWTDLRASPDFDVYAQRVDAAGVPQWTANGVAVGSGAGQQWFPVIAAGSSGSVIIAWSDKRAGDDIYAQRLTSAGAASWTANGVLAVSNASPQSDPEIVSDGLDGAYIAFIDRRNQATLGYDIYAQRINSAGAPVWASMGVAVCTMGLDQREPVLAAVPGGVVIAWEDYRPGTFPTTRDIFAQRLSSAGAPTWVADGIDLASYGGDQYAPSIASDGKDGVIVAWTDARTDAGDIFAARVDGDGVRAAGWVMDGTPVSVTAAQQRWPAVASDGDGGAIVFFQSSGTVRAQRLGRFGRPAIEPVATISDGACGTFVAWEDYSGGDADVRVQRFDPSGGVAAGWPFGGVLVSGAPGNQQYPDLCPDAAGGVFVVFEDDRSGPTDRDIYIQRVNGMGLIEPGWPTDGVVATDIAFDERRPQVVPDGSGGAFMSWGQGLLAIAGLYVQKVDAGGGLPLGSPTPLFVIAGYDAHAIDVDDIGGLLVAYESYGTGSTNVVRLDSDAGITWGPVVLSADGLGQHEAVILSDGTGGAYIAWRAESGEPPTPSQIMAQRLDAAGAVAGGWPAGGLGVCLAANHQYDVRIASDGTGGVLLAWTDERTAEIRDVYGQRVTSLGAALWVAGGLVLSAAAGDQTGPALIGDGGGGALVAWSDRRSGTSADPYAVRVTGAGAVAPNWTVGGVLVAQMPATTESGEQFALAIAGDGASGAHLAWFDTRGGLEIPDVRMSRIDAFGIAGDHGLALLRVRDVARDQGGQVQLTWSPHVLDRGPDFAIEEYWVWRQIPESAALAALAITVETSASASLEPARPRHGEILRAESGSGYYWEFMEASPASAFSGYCAVVATTSDSGASNPYTAFMVQARHRTLLAFWNSAPDSGYSVDNLAPASPAAFVVHYFAGGGASGLASDRPEGGASAEGTAAPAAPYAWLHWGPSAEPDFAEYRVHRGGTAGFVPTPANLIATLPDTGYKDLGAPPSFYKLVAIDVHGNSSVAAAAAPSNLLDASAGAGPAAVRLSPPSPNPAHGRAAIHFALPHAAPVRLEMFDAAGRLVRSLARGSLAAGEHVVRWDGADAGGAAAPNGIYFVRLRASGEERVVRLTMMR